MQTMYTSPKTKTQIKVLYYTSVAEQMLIQPKNSRYILTYYLDNTMSEPIWRIRHEDDYCTLCNVPNYTRYSEEEIFQMSLVQKDNYIDIFTVLNIQKYIFDNVHTFHNTSQSMHIDLEY